MNRNLRTELVPSSIEGNYQLPTTIDDLRLVDCAKQTQISKAKMNITSAITKSYKNERLSRHAETDPTSKGKEGGNWVPRLRSGWRFAIAIFGLKMGVGIRKTFKKFAKSSEKAGYHVQWRCITFNKFAKVGKKLEKLVPRSEDRSRKTDDRREGSKSPKSHKVRGQKSEDRKVLVERDEKILVNLGDFGYNCFNFPLLVSEERKAAPADRIR